MTIGLTTHRSRPSLIARLKDVPWLLVLLVVGLTAVSCAMLYSAAGGDWEPWAQRQAIFVGIGVALMLSAALMDIRTWFRFAYLVYFLCVLLLLGVEIAGVVGMGAKRWLDLGFVRVQPSEFVKIGVVLVLARYFHGMPQERIGNPLFLLWPAILVMVPAAMVLVQPKLGSAVLIGFTALVMFFVAGVRLWKFMLLGALVAGAVPIAWSLLHDYQKRRVLTFLNPESDPLGAGYHIIQSRIALGSGGMWGKGFAQGSQSQLQFLPEKQTDFIFAVLAEEFGLVGSLALLGVYFCILAFLLGIAARTRSQFARLLAIGVAAMFFANVFVNIAMVTGLLPVVGEPLPLMSLGGSAMIATLAALGLAMSAFVGRDRTISRSGEDVV
jgi:rod shape determining protein RodA